MARSMTLEVVLPGQEDPAVFHLTGQDALAGRDERSDLVLEGETVSARHGLFRFEAGGYTYTDMGSLNGSAIVKSAEAPPRPLVAGQSESLSEGDLLLLGAADAPVRVRVLIAEMPLTGTERAGRTVVAVAPLVDLSQGERDALTTLSGRALEAEDADGLGDAALSALKSLLPSASGYAVSVRGTGFSVERGDVASDSLRRLACVQQEVVLFEEGGVLPDSGSVVAQGLRAAVVVPLVAGGTSHGEMMAWSTLGVEALPSAMLGELAVAGSLMAMAACRLAFTLEAEVRRARLEQENTELRAGMPHAAAPTEPIGVHPRFLESVALCKAVATSTAPLLLLGETGTGKEVLARRVHHWSPRMKRAFVACNCAAVPDSLLESELFGHTRGAFTGANVARKGLFEEADGGTIFLDEIGEMPALMQAKLLRVLQDGEIRPVGATQSLHVDVRVVSATHRDLAALVEEGRFRADLMYRLNAVTVSLPALRERGDDVLLLAHHLLARVCARGDKQVPGFSPEALTALRRHTFPGNVRELENEIVRAVALTAEGCPIAAPVFSETLRGQQMSAGGRAEDPGFNLKGVVEQAERRAVQRALEESSGNVSQAAKLLGVTRPGLYKVMERLGLRES